MFSDFFFLLFFLANVKQVLMILFAVILFDLTITFVFPIILLI